MCMTSPMCDWRWKSRLMRRLAASGLDDSADGASRSRNLPGGGIALATSLSEHLSRVLIVAGGRRCGTLAIQPTPIRSAVTRFTIEPSSRAVQFDPSGDFSGLSALSRDGRTVACFTGPQPKARSHRSISVHLDQLEAVPLRGAESAVPVAFSPDGGSSARDWRLRATDCFNVRTDDTLKRVRL